MTTDEERGFAVVDRRTSFEDDDGEDVAEQKPTYVQELEQQVMDARRQVMEIKTQYKDALDEFENARARTGRDAAIEIRKGRRMVLADMIEVLDNLDRAIEAGSGDEAGASVVAGVKLVRDQFLEKLANQGVRKLPSLGAKFDPQLHQAITTVPVTDEAQDDVIVGVVQEGYTYEDDLLRPAQVAVGRLSS